MPARDAPPLQLILDRVYARLRDEVDRGKVADYIPELKHVDPQRLGLSIQMVDGQSFHAGDADTPFSIQSVSKVFTLTLALGKVGDALWRRVGREPSGSAFNSIVQLEYEHGIPRNPLINPGAIVVADILLGQGLPNAVIGRITDFLRQRTEDPTVSIDMEVAQSEADTGFLNASLANFLKAKGNLNGPVDEVLDVYFHQCALAMSCRQLARAALYLANDGVDPLTEDRVTTAIRARRINAVMMTCGHYDASGEFAFRVGLPGTSGVGGGILAVAPRRGAVAVWSPGLNAAGTSHVGALALERFAALAGWSVF